VQAEVAELVDALDSGSSDRKVVWVQVPSSAPKEMLCKMQEIAEKEFKILGVVKAETRLMLEPE
jgi:hypothetical protein